jgi:hypothetical protein
VLFASAASSPFAARSESPPPRQETHWTVAITPEEPSGYPDNPSSLEKPLRQNLTSARLAVGPDGRFGLELGSGDSAVKLEKADLALLVPHIPVYVGKDPSLVAYAALQREFNRNEVRFGAVPGADELRLANNCLKQGLWEVMLDKKNDKGSAMFFHGWFAFPKDAYSGVFEKVNGVAYADWKKVLEEYPHIDGLPAPLEKLRTVEKEQAAAVLGHPDEPVVRFGEQKRKAKLLLNEGIAKFSDFTDPAQQPIRTATFVEPGRYDTKQPVSFDLRWLAKPKDAIRRSAKTVAGGTAVDEVEIRFENGYRLVVADRDLGALPPRKAAPDADKDLLRLTFGIGTPDIYASLDERTKETAEARPCWIFLVGPDGKNVDNHKAGIDRVFAWCEEGSPSTLHLYLVGYERIAVVGHLSLPWVKV